jgi:hypothetical protein
MKICGRKAEDMDDKGNLSQHSGRKILTPLSHPKIMFVVVTRLMALEYRLDHFLVVLVVSSVQDCVRPEGDEKQAAT